MRQVVVITGAGTGIGALASASLAAAGHTVYATMRDSEGKNAARAAAVRASGEGSPGEVHVIELDVSSEQSCTTAIARVVDEQGRIDVVVNNAGHMSFGVTEAFTPDQLLEAYDVNCVGAQRVNRAALAVMRWQGAGLLLWDGPGSARAIPPFLGPYAAAKAAFDALAESTAWDVAALGIETTIIHPGVFTEGTQLFPDADAQIVADEITRIVSLEPGTRPRRSVADGSDYLLRPARPRSERDCMTGKRSHKAHSGLTTFSARDVHAVPLPRPRTRP